MIVAQITDTHVKAGGVLAFGRVDTVKFLQLNIIHINALRPVVDVVLVTGDMTDGGSVEEFSVLRKELDKLQMPYFVVPGNHDHRDHLREVFYDHSYLSDCHEFIQYAIEDFSFRFVGVDTLVSGKPHGNLEAAKLKWLDQCLSEVPDKPTFIFQHHPPFKTGMRHIDGLALQNGAEEMDLLGRHNQVKHVACGHVHRATETVMNGIGVSIAPNAAHAFSLDLSTNDDLSYVMEPPALRIFHLDDEAGTVVSHLSYVGDFPGPFSL